MRAGLWWMGLWLYGGVLAAASAQPVDPVVMTVLGPVPAAQLGLALTHEHVLVDWIGAEQSGPHRWDRDAVARRVRPHLDRARELGVQAFVDCSPAHLGRDPQLLRLLSRQTGLHVVTNTGLYAARGGRHVPEAAKQMPPAQLAAGWVTEWRDGIDGTDVRPGFIKIGVNGQRKTDDTDACHDATGRFFALNALDRRVVAAAAIAHRDTGLTVASHTANADPVEQMAIFAAHGVAPDALVWVHAQRRPVEDAVELARQGLWISYDNVAKPRVGDYLQRLAAMKQAELLHRVLLSHDSGWYTAGEPNGGDRVRGYDALLTDLIPAIQARGVLTDDELHQVLVDNPAQAFAVRPRLLAESP